MELTTKTAFDFLFLISLDLVIWNFLFRNLIFDFLKQLVKFIPAAISAPPST